MLSRSLPKLCRWSRIRDKGYVTLFCFSEAVSVLAKASAEHKQRVSQKLVVELRMVGLEAQARASWIPQASLDDW